MDSKFCFGPHNKRVAARMQQQYSILKALSGTTWGCDKETLLLTYRAIGRSIISYWCPAWTLIVKESHWQRLQRAQTSSLRIAVGCYLMACTYTISCQQMPQPRIWQGWMEPPRTAPHQVTRLATISIVAPTQSTRMCNLSGRNWLQLLLSWISTLSNNSDETRGYHHHLGVPCLDLISQPT